MREAKQEQQEWLEGSIPPIPEIMQSKYANSALNQPLMTPSPIFRKISGSLPGGKWLAHPLDVQIEEEDGEFLVSEAKYSIHASGCTLDEAIEEFKRVLSEEFDLLIADEAELGPRLQAQLQYLRNVIRAA